MTDDDRSRWARALTTSGWLFFLAYVAVLVSSIRRALAVSEPSFEDGVWGQRIEMISFAALPQNQIALAAATAAAIGAAWLIRDRIERQHRWIAQLVRAIAGTGYVVIAIAVLGILDVFVQRPDPVGGTEAVLLRVGGILLSIATIRLCLESERGTTSDS